MLHTLNIHSFVSDRSVKLGEKYQYDLLGLDKHRNIETEVCAYVYIHIDRY